MDSIILILLTSAHSVYTEEPSYHITNIRSNPGLYFERKQDLRLQTGTWIIGTSINLEEFQKPITPTNYQEICTKWSSRFNGTTKYLAYNWPVPETEDYTTHHCKIVLNTDGLTEKQEEILEQRDTISFYIQALTKITSYTSNRNKRLVPLGIIGTLAKSLFGLVTKDQVEKLQEQLQQMEEDQLKLINLEKEVVHLTATKLTKFNQTLYEHIMPRGKWTQQNYELMENDLVYWLDALTRRAQMESNLLDRQINQNKRVIEILKTLTTGKTPPTLYKMATLVQIIGDIRQANLEWELPEEIDNPTKLITYSRTDTVFINNSLLVTSHVPLVRKTKYELYQIHSVQVLQPHHEKPIMAYIKPEFQYLARSFDHKQYLKITQEDFTACVLPENQYHCPPHFLLIEPRRDSCETKILLGQQTNAMDCNIKISLRSETYWEHLHYQQTWIFSTFEHDTLKILCSGTIKTIHEITGMGILRLEPGCQAMTNTVTIPGEIKIDGRYQQVYDPDLHLNLNKSHPNLQENFDKFLEVQTQTRNNNEPQDQSFEEILSKIEHIKEHSATQKQNAYLYGLIGALFTTLFIIVTFLLIKYFSMRSPNKTKTKSSPKPKKETKDPPTENLELSGVTMDAEA